MFLPDFLFHLIFSALLVISFFAGSALSFTKPRSSLSQRLTYPLLGAGGVTVFFMLLHKVLFSVFVEQNWMRLQRTFIWARGFPLYPDIHTGPVLNAIYGPLSALAYWPATWVSPLQSVPVGIVCSIFFFFTPVLWLFLQKRTPGPHFVSFSWLSFIVFVLAASLLSSLKRSAFTIHADAPALGIAAMACAFIYLRQPGDSWKTLFLSAAFTVLAVWCKQTTAPVIPALLVYVGITEGRKGAAIYLASLFVLGGSSLIVAATAFDLKSLYYNSVLLPSRHGMDLKDAGKSVFRLFRENVLLAALALPAAWPSFRGPASCWLRENRWGLFAWVALWMAPFTLMAHIKIGGSNNTLSFVSYFMMLGTILLFIENAHRFPDTARNFTARAAMIAYAAILIVITIPLVFFRFSALKHERGFAREAFTYAAGHPGTVYFPRMTLVHLLTEGKVYHESEGLTDREWANLDVSEKQFLSHIPQKLELVAFAGEDHRRVLPLPGFAKRGQHPELPGFIVYSKEAPAS
jgi:hypothetical protein